MGVRGTDPRTHLRLPPGFRFYPTDEELLVQYLCRKVAGYNFSLQIIGEIDLYKFDPWDLPDEALFGDKEWYFFSPRDRKYPNGSRPNRMAGSGYWKATGTDKIITTEGRKVGIKKALVFYIGKAPKGTKTNWIMHEYRLSEPQRKNGSTRLDDWVLCRIYKKNSSGQKPVFDGGAGVGRSNEHSHGTSSSSSSQYDDVLESLPEIDDRFFSLPRMGSLKSFELQEEQKLNLQQLGSGNYFDWASLAGIAPLGQDIVQAQDILVPGANMEISGFRDNGVVAAPAATVRDEEVQSGQGSRFAPSMSGTVPNFYGSVGPYGLHFPGQHGGFGFRQ